MSLQTFEISLGLVLVVGPTSINDTTVVPPKARGFYRPYAIYYAVTYIVPHVHVPTVFVYSQYSIVHRASLGMTVRTRLVNSSPSTSKSVVRSETVEKKS